MTNLPDAEVQRLFRAANEELNGFYLERMGDDWVRFFAGEDGTGGRPHAMRHIGDRIEASLNTQDLSGRSG